MKSAIDKMATSKELKFPKLMIHKVDDLVILADCITTRIPDGSHVGHTTLMGGVVIHPVLPFKMGYYSITWAKDQFKDFLGTVILSND